MGKLIAIDKLYMNKIPNSCKECPLTYLDTGDDAYFGANERRCVIDDSCIDGMVSERAYDCPLVEAIPKDEYETRLKADMVAMLDKIRAEIEEQVLESLSDGGDDWFTAEKVNECLEIIDKYKAESEVKE